MSTDANKPEGLQHRRSETQVMEALDLETLLERARAHDPEALGEIYRRYARRVFGLCRYMLGSRESAEDAMSEVFLKLQRPLGVTTVLYRFQIGYCEWLATNALTLCGAGTVDDKWWSLVRPRPSNRPVPSPRHSLLLSAQKSGRTSGKPSRACQKTIVRRSCFAITAN
jgi:hypothetical protein